MKFGVKIMTSTRDALETDRCLTMRVRSVRCDACIGYGTMQRIINGGTEDVKDKYLFRHILVRSITFTKSM